MLVRGADKRSAVNLIMRRHLIGSPMEGMENKFEECEIDPLLMVAIAYQESQLGKAYADFYNAKFHNPFGLSKNGGLITYASWEEAIQAECNLLTRYINVNNAKSLGLVGATYAEDPAWPERVANYYSQLWHELENL